jgi:hypothetical protein
MGRRIDFDEFVMLRAYYLGSIRFANFEDWSDPLKKGRRDVELNAGAIR